MSVKEARRLAVVREVFRQAHVPKGSATVDIVQFADGTLELSGRVQVLKNRACGLHEHLGRSKAANDKTIDAKVDALRQKEQRRPDPPRTHKETFLLWVDTSLQAHSSLDKSSFAWLVWRIAVRQ